MSRQSTATRWRRDPLITLMLGVLVLTLTVTVTRPAEAVPGEPEPQGTSRVWQQGREVIAGFMFPGPDGPYPATRTVDVYLIGPVDLDDPQDAGHARGPGCGGGPGPCIQVPAHDDAMPPNVRGYQTRAISYGHWVLASDDAPDGAVLTRDVTATDLPPHVTPLFPHITELAYAIKVGDRYQPLTSTHWVDLGVRRGWLELDDSVGLGGTAWIIGR